MKGLCNNSKSYSAISLNSKNFINMSSQIPLRTGLFYAFETLEHQLKIKKCVESPQVLNTIKGNIPLFVTLYDNKRNIKGQDHLRGCIGTFTANDLSFAKTIEKYVALAAFKDTRFKPLTSSELLKNNMSISINILHSFENIKKWDDWEIGTHGTTIYFLDNRNIERHSTFLPSVAKDHGFSKKETIDRLKGKALSNGGQAKYNGESFYENLRVERYQSTNMSLTYQDYCQETRKQN
jgi:uncharacterized protein (TIGR00296 family)